MAYCTDILIPSCKPFKELEKQINEIENNTPENHRIIASCQNTSAAINRNLCLEHAWSDVIIMMDDDITGFYKGWLSDLIDPIYEREKIIILSANLQNEKTTMGIKANMKGVCKVEGNRVATGCIAIRRNDLKFDEKFKGSGYEDTDYCNQIMNTFGKWRMYVNMDCKLIHKNEMKKQGGEYFEQNKTYYLSKYPWDVAVISQKDWTCI